MLFAALCGTILGIMAAPDRRIETSETNRTLIIGVAVVAAILIAGLFYGLMRLGGGGGGPTGLQGAIREGSPQWEENKKNIVLDDPEATEAKRALGDITMTLSTTVFGLMPIFWATGRGSDVMQPMAIPSVGGMAVSLLVTIFIAPTLFCAVEEWKWKRSRNPVGRPSADETAALPPELTTPTS